MRTRKSRVSSLRDTVQCFLSISPFSSATCDYSRFLCLPGVHVPREYAHAGRGPIGILSSMETLLEDHASQEWHDLRSAAVAMRECERNARVARDNRDRLMVIAATGGAPYSVLAGIAGCDRAGVSRVCLKAGLEPRPTPGTAEGSALGNSVRTATAQERRAAKEQEARAAAASAPWWHNALDLIANAEEGDKGRKARGIAYLMKLLKEESFMEVLASSDNDLNRLLGIE